MNSAFLTESDATRSFVQPQPSETLAHLLQRCLPRVQTKRARAYNNLNAALRPNVANRQTLDPSPSPRHNPFSAFDHLPQSNDYRIICANVTEDLKLCSEAVMELRTVLVNFNHHSTSIRHSSPADIQAAINWLDTLQDLEEKKLVATVSVHALTRSINPALRAGQNTRDMDPAEVNNKIVMHSRQLNNTHESINELLQEVREFCHENLELIDT